ncbi:MAG: cyclopropane-fatty-acyl-phospholipid synthase family protein [Planctomycetota bacterium]
MNLGLRLAERGYVPDRLVRYGIRHLLRRRLREERLRNREALLREFRASPVAVATHAANEQHYELPAAFFELVLGPHLKYSSAWWDDTTANLEDAEAAMLRLTCDRAMLRDGQQILELGCGWGSLTRWMARHYPRSQITAVSNSHSQRAFIEARLAAENLGNVRVITADANVFRPDQRFDRVVSVEMFEHLRNPELLLRRIADWLLPAGRLFVHVFCHRNLTYLFGTQADDDWMGRHFFTGGMMPSRDLYPALDHPLELEQQWVVAGTHYARTAEAWLSNLDRHRADVLRVMREIYGATDAAQWLQRWRMFFLSCAELFAYANGDEWQVAHYRFRVPSPDHPKGEES